MILKILFLSAANMAYVCMQNSKMIKYINVIISLNNYWIKDQNFEIKSV